MGTVKVIFMATLEAGFAVGQVVWHRLFRFRGVIIDVDAKFQGTDEWYEKMASGNPPKDMPWYNILVHGSIHHAYAAESQLELDTSGEPVEHPELEDFFDDFQEGVYKKRSRSTN